MAPRKKKPAEGQSTTPMEVCYVHDPIHACCGLVVAMKVPGSIWSQLERDGPLFRVQTLNLPAPIRERFARGERCRVHKDTVEPWPEEGR